MTWHRDEDWNRKLLEAPDRESTRSSATTGSAMDCAVSRSSSSFRREPVGCCRGMRRGRLDGARLPFKRAVPKSRGGSGKEAMSTGPGD